MSIVEQIKSRVTLHDVASLLGIDLPARVGLKFRSPFRVDKNPSCSLYQHNGELRFRDWSAHVDVDLIGCYALARGVSNGDAIRELARELRIEQGDCIAESDNRRLARESVQPTAKASSPRPMPRQVADSWVEGTNYLARQPRLQERIAEWRGWPSETITQLAEDGMMGAPIFRGARLVAFRVDFPIMKTLGPLGRWFSTVQVGWHVRLKTHAGQKAQWRFVPNEKEHGHSTPALPFIMGDFHRARLLIITEGQFDCITVAHAAPWLSHDAAWPEGICILGLRGVRGVNPFLSHYAFLWPRDAKCWLLPDNDEAGKEWFETHHGEESFADKLSRLCAEVRVETIHGAKDFNQAWQRKLVTQADIRTQLQRNGFSDGNGRIL